MKLFVVVVFLAVSVLADVSHLKPAGYVYNIPTPTFELPSAPIKEYLPPTSPPPAPIPEEIIPEEKAPIPQYLPPVEVPAPILPALPSNEYLPPSESAPVPEIVDEVESQPIVEPEPINEYLPPQEPSVVPSTNYLPPSVPPTQEYQSAAETGGYRYEAPLTRFRF